MAAGTPADRPPILVSRGTQGEAAIEPPDARRGRLDTQTALEYLATAILLVAPLALAVGAGSEGPVWFAAGAAAWGISVVAKILAVIPLHAVLGDASPPSLRAALHGIVSAATELGVAAACLAWLLPEGSAWNAASFGLGAGWIEAALLLAGGLLARRGAAPTGPLPTHVRWTFLVERAGALLGHAGARGLVWLALSGQPWCGVVAVVSFSVVDGLAACGAIREWDWMEWHTWRRFYGFVTAVSVAELLLFVVLAGA